MEIENPEQYLHYHWSINPICAEGSEMVIKLDEPRCYIRYQLADALTCGYADFYNSIAEVQWLDGQPPEDYIQEEIFVVAWNFIALSERKMEEVMEEEFGDDIDL